MTPILQAICDDDDWLYAPLHCRYKHWSRDDVSTCLKGNAGDGEAVRVTVLGHSLERTNYYDLMYWLIGPRARDLGLHGVLHVCLLHVFVLLLVADFPF